MHESLPKFLKALDVVGLPWLTCLCMTLGAVSQDWQTGVVVPLFKKGDLCFNYRGITILKLPGKVYAGFLEQKVQSMVESQIQEEQCGFCPGHRTLDQLFALVRVLEAVRELAQPIHMCFADLEKAFDCVPQGVR